MIKNLKIKYKFFLLSSLEIISILLLFIFVLHIIYENLTDIERVFKDSKKVQKIQHDIIIPLFELKEKTLYLSITTNIQKRKKLEKKIESIVKSLDISFKNLDTKIEKKWQNYRDLIFSKDGLKNFSRFVYYRDGNFEKNLKIGGFLRSEEVQRKEFYLLVSKLKKFQEKKLQTSYNSFSETKINLLKKQKVALLVVLMLLVLTLYFSHIVAKDIVLSLIKVKDGLEKFFKFSRGEIKDDINSKIDINKDDEFGKIASIINENISTIKENIKEDLALIEDATEVVKDIKKGYYHKRLSKVASSKELKKLKYVINEMLGNLEEKILVEIKERVKQEKLLIQQSKLASMGNMIGNIAHQWRQPLSEINAILMNLEVKKEHNDLSDEVFSESLNECNIILSHMSHTITDFQNFFKPSKEKTKFFLKQECINASYVIESSLKYNGIKLYIDTKDECEVIGYSREFSQVILNILSNAKDVLLERKIKNPFINLILKKGKKYALIKIEDNARGIKESHLDKIFEPYFTTKRAKQGTGIGLYMSKIIIEENMHGYISVKNSDSGAIFTIKLKVT